MEKLREFFDLLHRVYPPIKVKGQKSITHQFTFEDRCLACMIYVPHGTNLICHVVTITPDEFEDSTIESLIKRVSYVVKEHSIGVSLKVESSGSGVSVGSFA